MTLALLHYYERALVLETLAKHKCFPNSPQFCHTGIIVSSVHFCFQGAKIASATPQKKNHSVFPRGIEQRKTRKQWALCMITSEAQNSPPSLVYANYSQPFATFTQFSRGNSFNLCYFGNSFMIIFSCLRFESEAWW